MYIMTNKLGSNLAAFLSGSILFSTDLFTQFPTVDRVGITFLGGYLVLSLYHAWKFASSRFSNFESILVFWLFPIIFTYIIVFSLIVGLIVSVPKFIISIISWVRKMKTKPSQLRNVAQRDQADSTYFRRERTNIISIDFGARKVNRL